MLFERLADGIYLSKYSAYDSCKLIVLRWWADEEHKVQCIL